MLTPFARWFVEPVPLWMIFAIAVPFLALEAFRAYLRYATVDINVRWMEHAAAQVKTHSESIGVLGSMVKAHEAATKAVGGGEDH